MVNVLGAEAEFDMSSPKKSILYCDGRISYLSEWADNNCKFYQLSKEGKFTPILKKPKDLRAKTADPNPVLALSFIEGKK